GKEAASLGAGKKSLAYTLTYRDKTRTLTNDEITVVHAKVRERLQRELGVELREKFFESGREFLIEGWDGNQRFSLNSHSRTLHHLPCGVRDYRCDSRTDISLAPGGLAALGR